MNPLLQFPRTQARFAGFSLIELLCVLAIIGVLLSLLTPTFSKAMGKARGVVGDVEISGHLDTIATALQRHVNLQAPYQFPTKNALIHGAKIPSRTARFLRSSDVLFHGLSYADPLNKPVLFIPTHRHQGIVVTKADILRTHIQRYSQ